VLGVARDADAKTIRDAFRTLALKYHPDRNKEPGAEERFKEIAEAYAILSDPNKRAAYDAGQLGGAGIPPEDLFGGINFEEIFGGLGFGFGDSFFDRIFRRHRRRGPEPGANLEIDVEVPLDKIAHGGEETVHLRHPAVCPSCNGSGAAAGTAPRQCAVCHGTGQRSTTRQEGGITFAQISGCAACGGRGSIVDKPCAQCAGSGRVEREETLEVRIPPGAEEGMALRVPGRGMPSTEPGGPPGDLFVVIRTAPDRRFERRGADLWHNATIGIPDAVLGTTLEVPTLDGPASVKVPAGTQPGSVLRLRNKGLPRFGGGGRGALYVNLQVVVPQRLSAEERKLYERLRAVTTAGRGEERPA
jgi:molecular chaperone DnaJ